MPDYQEGFRRMLTGIYSHTGAHILAAPMAHYLALKGSRFRFSHSNAFLPTYGIDQHVSNAKMIMQYREVNGKRIAYHTAMDYLFRLQQMETMCAFVFFRSILGISRSFAEKENMEHFEFSEGHPLRESNVAVYRSKEVIPVWSWKWLPSTSGFDTPLSVISKEDTADYQKKEDYARKLMILFLPFRNNEDLRVNGSHQNAFRRAYNKKRFDPEMIKIAENVQTIYNSLDSDMPENVLTNMLTKRPILVLM